MQWVVHAKESQRSEFTSILKETSHIHWVENPEHFIKYPTAELLIDLAYEHSTKRKNILEQLQGRPIIVNSVIHTLNEIPFASARINAWPGFLSGSLIEAAGQEHSLPPSFFQKLKPAVKWLEDKPGFITARVIAMIINEAYMAYEEGISTMEEIDIAMKLGTNYPYGPFEWSKKIGLYNIHLLLTTLSNTQKRYTPSKLITKEVSV